MMARSADRESRLSDVVAALLVVMLAVGILLRFYKLDDQGFWLDELWTAAASDPALSFDRWMGNWVLPDVHPPLYLFLVREWRLLFGHDELSLRLLSVVLSLALVAVVPLIQRWMPVVRNPLALMAWLGCSAAVILYAKEARPYALLLLLTMTAILLSVAIARRMEWNEPILWPCLALAGVVVVAEYSHYFGALVGVAMFGALAFFATAWHRRHLRTVMLSGVAAGMAFLPWLVFHVLHVSDKLGGNFWVSNNWSTTFPMAASLAAGSVNAFLGIAAAIAVALIARRRLLREPCCFVPLVAMAIMLLGAVAISLHTPVITQRNLLVLIPPFYVLALSVFAGLFGAARGRWRIADRLAAFALVATSLAFAIQHVTVAEKDQWRAAARQVTSLPGCRNATLQVYYWPEAIYAYYLPPPYRDNLRAVWVMSNSPYANAPVSRPDRGCPLILWSGHIIGEYLVQAVAEQVGLSRDQVIVLETKGNMLILDRRRLLTHRKDLAY